MIETSDTSIESIKDRINEIILSDKSSVLAGHKLSGDAIKYAFYLKRPYIPIGLSFQYRTALIATFTTQDDNTVIVTNVQTPPFVTLSLALAIFWFVFDFFILKSTESIKGKILLITIGVSTLLYHLATKNKIQESFNEEIIA